MSHTSGVNHTRIDALRTEVTSKNTLSPKRKAPDPQPPLAEVYGDTSSIPSLSSSSSPSSSSFEVTLTRPLGIHLFERDLGGKLQWVEVVDLVNGGFAMASKRVKKGDRLMAVNGIDTAAMGVQEVAGLVAAGATNVTLLFTRPGDI